MAERGSCKSVPEVFVNFAWAHAFIRILEGGMPAASALAAIIFACSAICLATMKRAINRLQHGLNRLQTETDAWADELLDAFREARASVINHTKAHGR